MLDFPVTDRDRERLLHDLELLAQFDQPSAPGRTPRHTPWFRRLFLHPTHRTGLVGAH